jgi:O-antigen ligase
MHKIIKGLIIFTVVSLPLIICPLLLGIFSYTKTLWMILLSQIIFWLWMTIGHFKLSWMKIAVLIFLFFSSLSAIFGVDLQNSLWSNPTRGDGLIFIFHVVAFFWVISSLLNKEDKLNLMKISVATSLFVASLSILSHLNFAIPMTAKTASTLGNTSFMSTYLLFNFFFAFYFFLSSKYKEARITSAVAMAMILLTIGLAGSKAAFGSVLLGFFIVIGFLYWKNPLAKKVVISLIVGSILCFLLVFWPNSPVQKQFFSFASPVRLSVWSIGYESFTEKPLLGWGRENFEVGFFEYFRPHHFTAEYLEEWYFDRAHNVVVEKLVSGGILGLLSYLFMLGTAVWMAWRKKDLYFSATMTALFFAHFLQNMTVFDTVTSYMMLFMTFALVDDSKTSVSTKKKWWYLIPLPFLIFFLVYQPAKTSFYMKNIEKDDLDREKVERILDSSFLVGHYIKRVAINELGSSNEEDIRWGIAELEKDLDNSFFFYYIRNSLYTSLHKEKEEYLPEAEEALLQSIEKYPNFLKYYLTLYVFYMREEMNDKALDIAQRAVDLEPRYGTAQRALLEVVLLTEDQELIEQTIKKALEANILWEDFFRARVGDDTTEKVLELINNN